MSRASGIGIHIRGRLDHVLRSAHIIIGKRVMKRPNVDALNAAIAHGIRASTGYTEEWAERLYGWYAWAAPRGDIQNERACRHTHKTEEAAQRCARRLQRELYEALR